MAAGTRTAPTVDGTGSRVKVSIGMLAAGEKKPRYESFIFSAASTNAEIEAFVAAYQALTTASVVAVEVSQVYIGTVTSANATVDGRTSFDDKVIMSCYNSTVNNRRYVNIAAPLSTLLPLDSETPDTSILAWTTFKTAYDAIRAGYDGSHVYFSERQQTNDPVPL